MSEGRRSSGGGIGIGTVVFVVLVVLKLLEVEPVAHWPWIWIIASLFIGVLIAIPFLGLILGAYSVGSIFSWFSRNKNMKEFMDD